MGNMGAIPPGGIVGSAVSAMRLGALHGFALRKGRRERRTLRGRRERRAPRLWRQQSSAVSWTLQGLSHHKHWVGLWTKGCIGCGDVRLRLRQPDRRGTSKVVLVRNVLQVEGAHNALSQSMLAHRELQVVPANGCGLRIHATWAGHRRRGPGVLVGVAR